MTAICSIAFPPSCWDSMAKAALPVSPTIASGKNGRVKSGVPKNCQTLRLSKSRKTRDHTPAPSKKKLSYLEAREYATIEERIAEAEAAAAIQASRTERPGNRQRCRATRSRALSSRERTKSGRYPLRPLGRVRSQAGLTNPTFSHEPLAS